MELHLKLFKIGLNISFFDFEMNTGFHSDTYSDRFYAALNLRIINICFWSDL